MRDVRRHYSKAPSGAQLKKLTKEAMRSLGSLSSALVVAGDQAAASRVDEVAGRLRGAVRGIAEGHDVDRD